METRYSSGFANIALNSFKGPLRGKADTPSGITSADVALVRLRFQCCSLSGIDCVTVVPYSSARVAITFSRCVRGPVHDSSLAQNIGMTPTHHQRTK